PQRGGEAEAHARVAGRIEVVHDAVVEVEAHVERATRDGGAVHGGHGEEGGAGDAELGAELACGLIHCLRLRGEALSRADIAGESAAEERDPRVERAHVELRKGITHLLVLVQAPDASVGKVVANGGGGGAGSAPGDVEIHRALEAALEILLDHGALPLRVGLRTAVVEGALGRDVERADGDGHDGEDGGGHEQLDQGHASTVAVEPREASGHLSTMTERSTTGEAETSAPFTPWVARTVTVMSLASIGVGGEQ